MVSAASQTGLSQRQTSLGEGRQCQKLRSSFRFPSLLRSLGEQAELAASCLWKAQFIPR